MSYRPVYTDQIHKCLNELLKRGAVGKRVCKSARAAISEYQTEGKISLPVTHHGETRLPNVTKYDLGENNHRLVVQRIGGNDQVVAFLFAGPHEEAQRWLENHRDYVWMRKDSDQTLEFVQATTREPRPATLDPDVLPDASLRPTGPLLSVVADSVRKLPFPPGVRDYILAIAAADLERDEIGIFDHLGRLDEPSAFAAHDLLHHAYRQEWPQLHARIDNLLGRAAQVEGKALAEAMLDDANAERFVTFDDLRDLPQEMPWEKWLLFLSPEQKEFARKPIDGPARLRGVSGSGKTCVLLHRAKHLVNEYDAKVLVVTSTESMRALLDRLLDQLCEGMIRSKIVTRTLVGLARDVICERIGCPASGLTELDSPGRESLLRELVQGAPAYSGFDRSELAQYDCPTMQAFLDEELAYLRSRLRSRDYKLYLDAKQFERRGRGRGLTVEGREVCILAAVAWEKLLSERQAWDDLALVQFALELIENDGAGLKLRVQGNAIGSALLGTRPGSLSSLQRYRSVLVDEVQDLSQLEISLLAGLPTDGNSAASQVPDGLYLVGDSAQAIYKKGFSLRACGIELAGARSFALKRNYRNTREILEAAFEVIKDFKYANLGDDSLAAPTSPEFALEHGPKPTIVACASVQDEVKFVVGQIAELRKSIGDFDLGDDEREREELPIGVVAAHPAARAAMIEELRRRDLPFGELRVNQPDPWNATVLCDIESCKGHEFQVVFVVGVQEGVFPRLGIVEDDLPREAARLYVAMTRAKRQLFVTHSTGAGAAPSPFLWLARPRCQESDFRRGRLEVKDEEDREQYAEADRRKWENWLLRLRQNAEQELPATEQPPPPSQPPQSEPTTSDADKSAQTEVDSPGALAHPLAPTEGIPHTEKLSRAEILAKLQAGELSLEQASKMLAEEKPKRGQLYCKVSEKGGLSVYGLQRMPVTLYADQWERLLQFEEEIRHFAEENRTKLSRKAR